MWGLLPLVWRAGIILVTVLAVSGTATGVYFKWKHDILATERARVEQEKDDAIRTANKAKNLLRERCASDPSSCVSDDWFRD